MAVGAVSAISGSSRQIIRKASGPVSVGVRPEPGWHRNIIAVSNLSAHVVQFTSAHYTLCVCAFHLGFGLVCLGGRLSMRWVIGFQVLCKSPKSF